MGRYLNVHEALRILNEHYVTHSIQTVTRWIREGKIIAERTENRKDGWRIDEDDLYEFITDVHPGAVQLIQYYKETNKIVELGEIPHKEIKGTIQPLIEKQAMHEPSQLEDKIKANEKKIQHLETKLENVVKNLELGNKQWQQTDKKFNESIGELILMFQNFSKEINEKIDKVSALQSNSDPGVLAKKFNKSWEVFSNDIFEYEGFDEYRDYESEIKEYYHRIYKDDKIIEACIVEEGKKVECPITGEKAGNPKTLFKKSIPKYLKQIGKLIDIQEGEEEGEGDPTESDPPEGEGVEPKTKNGQPHDDSVEASAHDDRLGEENNDHLTTGQTVDSFSRTV
ncbi:hypothetical protein D0469_01715 [Peribacillus saganii]|uniref:Helix-turn-helix domain-containing protein n=1 Tax=Peribacillus saganii TaxID=2303992 RepID=A0A372LTD6_9BACI|nr:hypothetical protein [Peribacillus saganii]RFU71448.1 hypothetical protein D0469_01715 [Peribacillus saganii]